MNGSQACLRCGAELSEYTSRGLCPSCLLREGLAEQTPEVGRQPEVGVQPRPSDSSPATPHSPFPKFFGDYELLELIARGGMDVVYKARQKSLNRIVAVKMLHSGQFAHPQFVQRFRAEAEVVAQLQHPNIVAIHEVGEHDGQPYFSMDCVEGKNLAQVIAEFGARSAEFHRCARWLKTIAEAVSYAHQRGIIHRDLKPSNVLIDAFDQPRITDFGLAKRFVVPPSGGPSVAFARASPASDALPAKAGTASELTVSGQVLGSPNYLPPEQAGGRHGQVGPPSDLYSLGAILYHLLTGRPPFQAESLTTLLQQVIETEPVAPRLLNPSIPRDLETICLKCLEKDVSHRYQTAQELSDELGRFLEEKPIQARPVGPAAKAWKWCRRRPALAGMSAALVLTFVLGLAGVVWQWHRASAGELLARQNAYAADMSLAQHALAENNRALAVSLLDKHRPGFGVPASAGAAHKTSSQHPDRLKAGLQTDLRHWEWRYLWQLCQGDELFTLHRYPRALRALAVSKDGTVLALACGDQVALWDLTTKRPLTALPIATTEALAFSPTGNLLAMGTQNANGQPAVHLWDVSASKVAKTLTHEAEVRSVAFSPDGKLLATFDNRGNIKVADWASDRTLTNFTVRPPRRRPIGVVVFSPDGNRLAIGEDYGHVQLLDLRTGTVVPFQTQSSEGVKALVFSANAKLLAATLGSAVRLWDANSGEPRGQLTNHTDWVMALAFTPDGRQLASTSRDGTIRIWSVADHRASLLAELRRGAAGHVHAA